MPFLLDTNAVISLLNDAGSKLSHELYYGAFKSKRISTNCSKRPMPRPWSSASGWARMN